MPFTDQEKEQFAWSVIDRYFTDNPDFLVKHHIDSYDDLIENGIPRIFRQNNPIRIIEKEDEPGMDGKTILQCSLYMGGRDGTRIYYGKPVVYDATQTHYMYPNEARIRNMTYGMSIHYDVDVDFTIIKPDGTTTSL